MGDKKVLIDCTDGSGNEAIIAEIIWEDKKANLPKTIKLANGQEIRFCSSGDVPSRGSSIRLCSFCDWKAATMRRADGNILHSVEINQKRFGYSDELKSFILNTIRELGLA